jgi:hypothetical protein
MRFSRVPIVVAATLLAAPATADLTPADVWQEWQAGLNSFGLQVSGDEIVFGDSLTIENITIEASMADDLARVTIDMGTVRFVGDGAGGVDVKLPDEITADMAADLADGPTQTSRSVYRQTDMAMKATGAPGDVTYTYSAPEITVETTSTVEAENLVLQTQVSQFGLSDVAGESLATLGATREITTDMTAAAGVYRNRFSEAVSGAEASIAGTFVDMVLNSRNSIPLVLQQDVDLGVLLDAGLSVTGEVMVGANRTEIATRTDAPFDGVLASETATVAFALGQEGLGYDIAQTGLEAQFAGNFMPLPVSIGVEDTAFSLGFPVMATEEPSDFDLGMRLNGLTLSENLWAIFDPSGGLPRDPARVVLELSGKARLLFDLLDPPAEAARDAPDFSPAELESLAVDALDITALGTSLTGSGAFAFAEPAPDTNLPLPNGSIDLTLVGANGLLDNLVALGLMAEDQAMGARMMMGLLGVPGDAPDTLRSTISVNEQFHIFANGQRIQ